MLVWCTTISDASIGIEVFAEVIDPLLFLQMYLGQQQYAELCDTPAILHVEK